MADKFAVPNVILSSIALIINLVSVASPYWLTQDFEIRVPASSLTKVEDNMGLFTNCKDYQLPNGSDFADCGADGAIGWQFVAAGMAVLGLFFGGLATVFSWLRACMRRFKDSKRWIVSIALLCLFSVGFTSSTLIMYGLNDKFQPDEHLDIWITFDHDWAYFLCVASSAVYTLLILTNVLSAIDADEKNMLLDRELSTMRK